MLNKYTKSSRQKGIDHAYYKAYVKENQDCTIYDFTHAELIDMIGCTLEEDFELFYSHSSLWIYDGVGDNMLIVDAELFEILVIDYFLQI